MDTQGLFEHGGSIVRNPNYSPNNGQPEFIRKTDVSKSSDPLASALYRANELGLNYTITDSDLIKKAKKYNVPLTRESIESGAIDKQLYDAQSGLSMFLNAVEQTVVSEIGLGTLKGFSEIGDMIGNAISQDKDFFHQGAITRWLSDLQEKNNERFNINTLPDKHLGTGGLFNAGWWASNIPSIASSFTLLIPAKAVTKAVTKVPSLIGKGVSALNKTGKTAEELGKVSAFSKKGKKALQELNKVRSAELNTTASTITREYNKQVAELMSNAALMRTMENYQEAKQVNEDVFESTRKVFENNEEYANILNNNPQLLRDLQNQDIDINDKDAVARYIAKKSATKTFLWDYTNIVFDVVQLAALKNPAKIAKDRIWAGKKVARAQRQSIEKPLQTADATNAIEKTLKPGQKIINNFKDIAGAIPTIAAESSEGVEEAVNYIAQQWGMTYGNILLGKEEYGHGLADRLKDYMEQPEMWDAAFWGFLGGIAFEVGGSKFNLVSNAISQRREDKKAGREVKSFGEYLDAAEDNYRFADINNRAVIMNDFIDKITLVNQGKNPYKQNEDGSFEKFSTNVEKGDVTEQIKDDFITSLTLNAVQAGNYRLLRDYLEDENVRKALIEKGVIDEAGANEYMTDILSRMDKVSTMYETNLDRLDKLTYGINEDIPIEYLQMIARKNTLARLNISDLKLNENRYQAEIDRLLETYTEDPTLPLSDLRFTLENKTKLNILAFRLAEVQATLRELKDEKIKSSINGAISIAELEKQRDSILKEIKTIDSFDNTAASVWALLQAENAYLDENGKLQINQNTKSFITYAEAIQKRDENLIKQLLTSNNLEDLANNLNVDEFTTDNKQGTYNLFTQSLNEYNEFIKKNKYLYEQQQKLEYLKLLELETKSRIITNQDDLLKQIRYLNESLKDVADVSEKQAQKNILDIASKIENGEKVVYDYLFEGIDNEALSEQDKVMLNSAKDIIKFTDKTEGYRNRFTRILSEQQNKKLIKQKQEEKKNKEEQEKFSSTFQNGSESTETESQEERTQSTEKLNGGQQNGSSGSVSSQNVYEQTTKVKVTINADENNPITLDRVNDDAEGNNIVPIKEFSGKNIIRLDIEGSKNEADLLTSTTLFDGYDKNKESDKKYTRFITSKPVILITKNEDGSNKYEVRDKGTIEYREESSSASSSFTGEVKQNDITDDNGNVVLGENDAFNDLTQTKEGLEISTRKDEIIKQNIDTYKNQSVEQITEDVNSKLAKEFENADEDILNAVLQQTHTDIASIFALDEDATEDEKKAAEGVAEIVRQSRLDEKIQMSNELMTDINKILQYYINKNKLPSYQSKVDGKNRHYINLRGLLEDINELFDDRGIVEAVYNYVKAYLNTNSGKEHYATTEEDVTASDFVDRINSREIESTTDNIQEVPSIQLTKEQQEEFRKLNPGSKIKAEIDKKSKKGDLALTSNGIKIGSLPAPRVLNNGIYSLWNDGWNYIISTDNGYINSNLLPVFKKLLNNKDIYNTLLEIKSNTTTVEEKEKLKAYLSNLITNYEYNGKRLGGWLVYEGEDKNSEYQEIDHLLDLISYDLQAEDLQQSIYNYIKKLYSSYKTVDEIKNKLKKGENVEISVEDIPVGKFSTVVDYVRSSDYEQLNQSNSQLLNLDEVKLGIQERTTGYSGKVKFNDGSDTSIDLLPGAIIVSIPNRNGQRFYTRALAARLNDDKLQGKAAEVRKFIFDEINRRIDDWSKTDANYDSFVDLCKKLFFKPKYGQSINEPLLYGINFNDLTETKGKIQIGIKNKGLIEIYKDRIAIITPKTNGEGNDIKTYYRGKSTTQVKKAFNSILNNSGFNISFNLLKDFMPGNSLSKVATESFITKKPDGSLNITIPSIEEQKLSLDFNDYKDFILGGGFVRVNTKNNGASGNFERTSKTSGLKVKVEGINLNPNFPVKEEIIENETPASEVENVFNDRRHNLTKRAFEIANMTEVSVGNEKINVLKTLKDFGLLSRRFKFEETFNGVDENNKYTGAIAEVDSTDGIIKVGRKWLDMFNEKGEYAEPGYRQVALRKLLHEQLHIKFHTDGNDKYVKNLKEVFEEFKDYVNTKETDKATKERMQDFFFSEITDDDDALEEFVVESFTNGEVARYLNSIQSGDFKVDDIDLKNIKKDGHSLFQKILYFLGKIFGWNINNNSLYAKEFTMLADAFSQNTEVKEQLTQEEINKSQTENDEDDAFDAFDEAADIRQSTREEVVYNSEMQSIKDKAIADGTFMKAPNGNSTNLTEKQWLQVRTKAFKDWFGDWENDPKNASKVVDKNGEPLVVYHGNRTDNKITVFDLSKKGSQHREREISGFWFVNDERIATNEYAFKPESWGTGNPQFGETLGVFLNVKDPVISKQDIKEEMSPYGLMQYSREKLGDFIHTAKLRQTDNTDGFILTMLDSDSDNVFEQSKQTQFVVFNPNQIKSATGNNGEFSRTNNNIYQSTREERIDNVNDLINAAKPEDKEFLLQKINNGEISVKCN